MLSFEEVLRVMCARGQNGTFTFSETRAARIFARDFAEWCGREHGIDIVLSVQGGGYVASFLQGR